MVGRPAVAVARCCAGLLCAFGEAGLEAVRAVTGRSERSRGSTGDRNGEDEEEAEREKEQAHIGVGRIIPGAARTATKQVALLGLGSSCT